MRNGPLGGAHDGASRKVNGASEPSGHGSISVRELSTAIERWDVEPPSFGPGLKAQFRQLNSLRAFVEVVNVWRVSHDVAEEELPLVLECVVELAVVRDGLPVGEEVERIRHI